VSAPRRRPRNSRAHPARKVQPDQNTTGVAIRKATHRRKSRIGCDIAPAVSRYKASVNIIACTAPSPATPRRSSARLRSATRARSRSMPVARLGRYPSDCNRRKGVDKAVRAGSHAMRMRPVTALAETSRTPTSRRNARSINHAHAAQRMPSVSNTSSRPPGMARAWPASRSSRSQQARSSSFGLTRPAASLRRR
jgi:hypothetical protein